MSTAVIIFWKFVFFFEIVSLICCIILFDEICPIISWLLSCSTTGSDFSLCKFINLAAFPILSFSVRVGIGLPTVEDFSVSICVEDRITLIFIQEIGFPGSCINTSWTFSFNIIPIILDIGTSSFVNMGFSTKSAIFLLLTSFKES